MSRPVLCRRSTCQPGQRSLLARTTSGAWRRTPSEQPSRPRCTSFCTLSARHSSICLLLQVQLLNPADLSTLLQGWPYVVDEGGGAFYGPKIDVKVTASLLLRMAMALLTVPSQMLLTAVNDGISMMIRCKG
jgi:hypothetical protein